MQHPAYPAALMVGAVALWGSGFVMNKASLASVPPLQLLALELLASCTLLWTVAIGRGEQARLNRRTVRHGLTGLLEPGLAYILFISGLTMTGAANASILAATQPVMVVGLAWLLLREPIPPRLLRVLAAAMVGTLLVTVSDAAHFNGQTLRGDVLILLSTGCASLYVLFSRAATAELPPALLAALQQSVGLLCVLAALTLETFFSPPAAVTAAPGDYLVVIVSGIMQYALAFLLYLSALRYISATRAVLFIALLPVFGMGNAVLWLGESVTLMQVIGAGLVVAALLHLHLQGPDDHPSARTTPVEDGDGAYQAA
jgi:drug/metabolite transporter (DMT)-like permease